MRKTRVGIIGMGMMGVSHALAYRAISEKAELVGMVETNTEIHHDLEQKFGVPCYRDFDALLKRGIDAVSICTPDDLHFDFIMKALENNVKVLCEKPLEVSSERCRKIIDKMPNDTFIMVGHTMRFDPRLIPLKAALDQDRIGKVVAVKINRSNTRAVAKRISPRSNITWFLGIHDIDILLWLLDKKVVKASGYAKNVISNQIDYSLINLIFEDGIIGTMENHWLLPNARPLKLDSSISIIGDKGMLEADLNAHPVYFSSDDAIQYFDSYLAAIDLEGLPRGDMYREIQHFIDCVQQNKTPCVTAAQAAQAVSVIELALSNIEMV